MWFLNYIEWFVLGLPLLGGLIVLGGHTWLSQRVQNRIAGGSIAAAILLTLPMLAGQAFEPTLSGESQPWAWLAVWDGQRFIEGPLRLYLDLPSTWMVLLTLLTGLYLHLNLTRWLADSRLTDRPHHLELAALNSMLVALLLFFWADNLPLILLAWSWSGWGLYWLTSSPHKTAAMPLILAFSDLLLLTAVGLAAQTFASLSIPDMLSLHLSATITLTPTQAIPLLAGLLGGAALLRAAQFPWHRWIVADDTSPVLPLLVAIPTAIWLLGRFQPWLVQTRPVALSLAGWGGGSALLLAGMALARPAAAPVLIPLAAGGLALATVGVSTPLIALAFLPALLWAIALCAADAQDSLWRRSAFLALSGLPPLPGFFLITRALAAAWTAHPALGLLMGLAALALTASSVALAWPHSAKRPGRAGTTAILSAAPAIALLLWGLAHLTRPPLPQILMQPTAAIGTWSLAGGWWAAAIALTLLGSALGYGLTRRRAANPSWVGRVADGYAVHQVGNWIADRILALGQWLAQTEASLSQRVWGWLARRLWPDTPTDNPFEGGKP